MEKKMFRDFVDCKKFTIYEVFNCTGIIRKFDTAILVDVNGDKARLITSLMTKLVAPCDVLVSLDTYETKESECSTIFTNEDDAKKYAINVKLQVIEKFTKEINDINNGLIEKVD